MNIAVIGSGIAAHALIFHLERSFPQFRLTCFSASHLIPPCSMNSTAVVTLRETTRGLSPFGDIICDGFDAFETFFKKYNPSGVQLAEEEQWWDPEGPKHAKFERRFKNIGRISSSKFLQLKRPLIGALYPAYVIEPRAFLQFLKQNSQCEFKQELVTEVMNQVITLHSGEKQKFDFIFDCTGYLTSFKHGAEWNAFLETKQNVSGSFFVYDFDYGPTSWSVGLNDFHLIYRAGEKKLCLGNANDKNSLLAPMKKLDEIREELKNNFHLNLPDSPAVLTGVRSKTPGRMPFWGEVAPHTFAVNGLYKHGFSFAFLSAENLTSRLSKAI